MPFDSHFVVPDPTGRRLLLLPDGAGWRLPRWPLADDPPERDPGFPVAIRAWLRNRLGIDGVVLYWQNVEAPPPATAAGPLRQSIYAVEGRTSPALPPAGGRWVGSDDLGAFALAEPHHRPVLEAWLAEASGERLPTPRQPWQRVGWFEETSRWIEDQLRRRGVPAVSPVTQWHTKGGCCLLRACTAAGGAYFKALPAMYAREPLVTRRLAALRPEHVAEVLAIDADRRWLLTTECDGVWLPELDDARAWERALRDLAGLQIACTGLVDELLGLGCPDLRLDRLPALLDVLLSDRAAALLGNSGAPAPWVKVGVTPDELDGLRSLAPRLAAACARLAEHGVPETLEHGDFHPGQVIVVGGRPVDIDWADSAVSHPFFSLVRFLTNLFRPNRSTPHPVPGLPSARERLRDAYLEPWTAYAPAERLREAVVLAHPLAALEHALNYHQLDATRRGIPWERSAALPQFLRLLLKFQDELPGPGAR